MTKQTTFDVNPMKISELFEVSHREASHKLEFEVIGTTPTRGIAQYWLDIPIEFYLWDSDKHKGGDFTIQSMARWKVDAGILERFRVMAAKEHKSAKKRLGVKVAI